MAKGGRPPWRRALRNLPRSRSGNVATITALLMPVALALAAVAVDEGSLYVQRRHIQNLTDLAAISAASDIGHAGEAANALLKANGVTDLTLIDEAGQGPAAANTLLVEPGRYVADSGVAVGERFQPGAAPYNAARVTALTIGTTYFSSSFMSAPTIGATAIAGVSNEAAFSIGSRLASLNGGIVNAILGKLLGTNLSLSVMDYNALLNTDVDVLAFSNALASQLHITAGTYDDVLQSQVTVGQFAAALASVSGDPTARAALQAIVAGVSPHGAAIPLSHVISLGSVGRLALGEKAPGLTAAANIMEILSAGAAVANGEHQVALDLALSLPGLAGATVDLAIGEPPQQSPWFTIGEKGDIVRTAQTRLSLIVEIGGPGGILGTSIRVPIYLELAFAEGQLGEISCPTGRPDSLQVTVDARPGVAEAWIGEVDTAGMKNFAKSPPVAPATLVRAPLITVTGAAHATMSNPSPTPLTFTSSDIRNKAVKSVSTHNFTDSLFKSLLGDLDLHVQLAGLGLGTPTLVTKTLATTLGAVTPSIDDLLNNLLATLGVKIGEADIRVTGGNCGRSVLVQ